MKVVLIALAFCLSFSSFAFNEPYELQSVPHVEIDSYLTIGSDETQTPKKLQGLWWLDGNPLPDEVVSFAASTFEPLYEAGQLVGYRAEIPVFDEGIWSWHGNLSGWLLYTAALKTRLVYIGVFNAELTEGQITPLIQRFGFPLPPSMLLDFTMTQIDDNEWSRDSVVIGQPSSYRFRRIVDGNGNRLAAWDDYVTAIETRGPENALLPFCKDNTSNSLPTSCAIAQ